MVSGVTEIPVWQAVRDAMRASGVGVMDDPRDAFSNACIFLASVIDADVLAAIRNDRQREKVQRLVESIYPDQFQPEHICCSCHAFERECCNAGHAAYLLKVGVR